MVLSAEQKKKHATIIRRHKDGTVEYKFPMPDKAHARNALARIDQSDLTDDEKEKVRRRANRILGAKHVKEGEIIDPTEFSPDDTSNVVESNEAIEAEASESYPDTYIEKEASEVKGSSMGGHSPKADITPERNLVRSFGKWAKGKQHVCVRVLTTHHPELCASRPGGCNGLCAWMKDQWAHTTKWRTGNKKNLVKKAAEAYMDLGDGEEFILPLDLAIEVMAIEADIEAGKRDWHPRPDWFGDKEEALLIELLENDTIGESTEADISYSDVRDKLSQLINVATNGKYANDDEVSPSYTYCYVKDVFPGYVIYAREYKTSDGIRECDLYKQAYTVASGKVSLAGDPSKVVQTYVAAESDVDEPVSNPATESELTLEKKQSAIREALMKAYYKPYKVSTSNGSSAAVTSSSEDTYPSVKETYDTYVIFTIGWDGDLMKQSYTWSGDDAILSNDAQKVEIKYVPVKESESDLTIEKDNFVLVSTEAGTLVVETDDSGTIIRGPGSLIGMKVPEQTPSVGNANEALVLESGILKGAGISEVEVAELVIQEADVIEATTEKELTTPSGKSVDAIIRVITPGPGNARDRFYYTKESIKNTINVFDGKKMYKNHTTRKQDMEREGQPRSVEDWVATVEETWTDDKGIGYGGITFVDEAFQAKAKKGMKHLGVSVRGRVKARPASIGGLQYNVVEGFSYGGSVDFVTEAGAGGGFVSIAESDIMEGLMDPKEMSLEQLMEANPGAFVEYAETLKAESKESSDDDTKVVTEGAVTLEQLKEVLGEFGKELKKEIKDEVQESLTTRDVQDNRMILESKLKASDLPKATKARLTRELHDVTFDGVEATESEPAKTPLEVFSAHVDTMIAEATEEIKEATATVTVVDDGGSGELVVTESGRVYEASNGGVLNKMSGRLGIKLGESSKAVQESASTEADAPAATS